MKICPTCSSEVTKKANRYCNKNCEKLFAYFAYMIKWHKGEVSGQTGIRYKTLSGHIEKYIRLKYGNKCARCGWAKINPITKRAPLDIDHIDGNHNNNHESNLILLCPNCHALTPTYKNLNKGNGRKFR